MDPEALLEGFPLLDSLALLEGEKAQQAGPLTTGLVDDYKLYNNIYNSQTAVSWSLEGQVRDVQVYMSCTFISSLFISMPL